MGSGENKRKRGAQGFRCSLIRVFSSFAQKMAVKDCSAHSVRSAWRGRRGGGGEEEPEKKEEEEDAEEEKYMQKRTKEEKR